MATEQPKTEHDLQILATFEAQCEGLPLLDGEVPAFADSLRKATLQKLREQYAETIAGNIDDRLAAAEAKTVPVEGATPPATPEPVEAGATPPPAL